MAEYTVSWTIDAIDAKTPVDAARLALEIQRDPGSTATVFEVKDSDTKKLYIIDLEGEEV